MQFVAERADPFGVFRQSLHRQRGSAAQRDHIWDILRTGAPATFLEGIAFLCICLARTRNITCVPILQLEVQQLGSHRKKPSQPAWSATRAKSAAARASANGRIKPYFIWGNPFTNGGRT